MGCWMKRCPLRNPSKWRAAQRSGANVRLTIYPDAHHEAWEQAYADDRMWAWLLAQKRG